METKNTKYRGRQLKADVKQALKEKDFQAGLAFVRQFPGSRSVNPVISFFCSADKNLRWRSVSALGLIIHDMAETSGIEKARIVMRRLMWTLNEESGGVGWGAPEAMGEVMALNHQLADEYHRILVSYIDDHGNYLDYEPLRQGVLWGIYRLAQVRPELVGMSLMNTRNYLHSENAVSRGLAVRISHITGDLKALEEIKGLLTDETEIEIYDAGYFNKTSVRALASAAIDELAG